MYAMKPSVPNNQIGRMEWK